MAKTFLFLSQMVTYFSSDSEYSGMTVVAVEDVYKSKDDQPVLLIQAKLNDLKRILNYS